MSESRQTSIPGFTLRFAQERDVPLILSFIHQLAAYEKLADQVVATEEILHDSLFVRRAARVVLGEWEGEPVASALFFYNFSTFEGRPGVYLEDLFVRPDMRGRGFGSAMLAFLADTAVKENCSRLEWVCLDWNESAIAVYDKLNAKPMKGWTIRRLDGEALSRLASRFEPRERP